MSFGTKGGGRGTILSCTVERGHVVFQDDRGGFEGWEREREILESKRSISLPSERGGGVHARDEEDRRRGRREGSVARGMVYGMFHGVWILQVRSVVGSRR